MVDFIGIGAAKAGTTWLADNLRLHPQIFIPDIKEVTYFNPYLIRLQGVENPAHSQPLSWYHSYFAPAQSNELKGEISVQYLLVPGTAQAIYNYNPNIKLLVILRDPPKQVFSWYRYSLQRGVIGYSSLAEAIEKRPDMFCSALYYKQLKPYYDLFPSENIKVLFFEDIKKDNRHFFKEVTQFLGVSDYYPATLDKKTNTTKALRFPMVTRIIQGTRHFITKNKLEFLIPWLKMLGVVQLGAFIRDKGNVKKVAKQETPVLSAAMEQELRHFYAQDIAQLEVLLGKDLSHWKAT